MKATPHGPTTSRSVALVVHDAGDVTTRSARRVEAAVAADPVLASAVEARSWTVAETGASGDSTLGGALHGTDHPTPLEVLTSHIGSSTYSTLLVATLGAVSADLSSWMDRLSVEARAVGLAVVEQELPRGEQADDEDVQVVTWTRAVMQRISDVVLHPAAGATQVALTAVDPAPDVPSVAVPDPPVPGPRSPDRPIRQPGSSIDTAGPVRHTAVAGARGDHEVVDVAAVPTLHVGVLVVAGSTRGERWAAGLLRQLQRPLEAAGGDTPATYRVMVLAGELEIGSLGHRADGLPDRRGRERRHSDLLSAVDVVADVLLRDRLRLQASGRAPAVCLVVVLAEPPALTGMVVDHAGSAWADLDVSWLLRPEHLDALPPGLDPDSIVTGYRDDDLVHGLLVRLIGEPPAATLPAPHDSPSGRRWTRRGRRRRRIAEAPSDDGRDR